MTAAAEKNHTTDKKKMNITVQGRRVVLLFAERPNPEIAVRVKQALMGTYMMTVK